MGVTTLQAAFVRKKRSGPQNTETPSTPGDPLPIRKSGVFMGFFDEKNFVFWNATIETHKSSYKTGEYTCFRNGIYLILETQQFPTKP